MAMGTTATGLDFGQLRSELAPSGDPYAASYPAGQISFADWYKGGTYTPHSWGGKGLIYQYLRTGSYRYCMARTVSGVFRTYYYFDGAYVGSMDTKSDGLLVGSYYYGRGGYVTSSGSLGYYSIWRAEPWAHAASGQIDLGSFSGQAKANWQQQYNDV